MEGWMGGHWRNQGSKVGGGRLRGFVVGIVGVTQGPLMREREETKAEAKRSLSSPL